jgi:hypothetical protein
MIDDHSRIPVCESDFLQDVSIELGRRLKSLRHRAKPGRLEFRISTTERDDGEWECFDVTCWMGRSGYIQVVICENGVANYMYCETVARKHDTTRYEGYIITIAGWTPSKVADLMHDSLLDENDVRKTWRKLDQRKRN